MRDKSTDRLVLGISSCLLGERVRYDGTDKLQPQLVAGLSRYFTLLPVCPEAGAGLGVPRPPIKLVIEPASQALHAVLVDNPAQQVTEPLTNYIRTCVDTLDGLSGFVFKARSPSCGLHDAVIESGTQQRPGPGLFATALTRRYPELPVADELELAHADRFESFCRRVYQGAGRRFPVSV